MKLQPTCSHEKADRLIRSFRQVHRAMANLLRMQGEALDLTPVQMLIVRVLGEEEGLSLSELSDRLELGCSTVSVVVKRLVETNVVARERLEKDQRTVAIRLTRYGRELYNKAYGDGSFLTQALQRFVELPEKQIDSMLRWHEDLIHVLRVEGEQRNDG